MSAGPDRGRRRGLTWIEILVLAGVFGGGLASSAPGLPARGIALMLMLGALLLLARAVARERRARASLHAACQALQKNKRDFVAVVSHELRTPLTAIVGFSELLTDEDRPIAPARREEYLRIVRQQSRHLARTIEDAVDLSRLEDGWLATRPVTLSLHDALEGALMLLDAAADRDRIDIALASDTPPVCADQAKLEQVLDRLLQVALTRSARHSRVWVQVGPGADGCAQVAVSATGLDPGSELFAPLARTPEAAALWKHGQRYMAMAAARALVEFHGGRIWTEQAGEETTMYLHLPPSPAPEPLSAAAAEALSLPVGASETA